MVEIVLPRRLVCDLPVRSEVSDIPASLIPFVCGASSYNVLEGNFPADIGVAGNEPSFTVFPGLLIAEGGETS